MKIGIFSKCGHAGGSEFRCAELANGIARYTDHQAFLLCEGPIHPRVLMAVGKAVSVRLNVVRIQEKVPALYGMDVIIIVNTDSREFADVEYWQGKTERHSCVVDLSRVKTLVFLFNFGVEPATRLPSLFPYVSDVRIITANTPYFRSLSTLDIYREIRHLPRLVLPSPIDPSSVSTHKRPAARIRIGQYSMPYTNKFNPEIAALVTRINEKYAERVSWQFMGMPGFMAGPMARYPNVALHEVFALRVADFLEETDIFLFYPTWDREEPWARSIAEALMSGSPVVATDKGGNCDQIIPGNNGYLCRSLDDFVDHLSEMIEHPELIRVLGRNAALYGRYFSTAHVIGRLMEFIR
jgi:hypothetical protein